MGRALVIVLRATRELTGEHASLGQLVIHKL